MKQLLGSYTKLPAVVTGLRFEVPILILPSTWHTILQESPINFLRNNVRNTKLLNWYGLLGFNRYTVTHISYNACTINEKLMPQVAAAGIILWGTTLVGGTHIQS